MKRLILLLFVLFNSLLAGQLEFSISLNENSSTRKIILLNKNWTYETDEESRKVSVPFWIDEEKVTLRNKIRLNESTQSIYFLRFEGVRGLDEIYFNDERIPFDKIELEKFSFRIPSNIVRENGENFIKLVLTKKFRIKEQNVLASRLELPERKSGIFKDVYLELLPTTAITNVRLVPVLDENLVSGSVNFSCEISSLKHNQTIDSKDINFFIEVIDPLNSKVIVSYSDLITVRSNSIIKNGSFSVKNPILWNYLNPFYYNVRIRILQGDNLIDELNSHISFRRIELKGKNLFLNNQPMVLRGLTYFESNGVKNSFFKIKDYERDIKLIKELNVNAIFVKNSIPSDELLFECEENGILVFVDLDSKIYPEKILSSFKSELAKKLNFVIDNLSNYGCFAGLNLAHIKEGEPEDLINSLIEKIESSKLNVLKFVESENFRLKTSSNLDFIAYNFLHKSKSEILDFINNIDEEKFSLISAIGYNHGLNEKEGYSNPYSVQAQAKFLSEILKELMEKNLSFFVHTFSDYRLDYHSIIAGKIDNQLMKYGLVNEYRDRKKLSYHTYKSFLNESKLPIIMQGEYTEKANIIFVVAGLIFLSLSIITINSTHRFRENVSRAVLKTYNFFSDIRDGWFISSFHSFILALAIALSSGLLYSSLFFYWKDKIEFEKFVSLFNSETIFEFVSYVSWRPIESIIYFTLISIILMLLLTVVIRFFNFFVRNKIFMNHAFLISVWSAIPFLILIPVSMVGIKVLSLQKYNLLVYTIVILFHLWVITRILKGVSIVFEVRKTRVYFVALTIIIVVLASLILYLQINFSSVEYFMEYFG